MEKAEASEPFGGWMHLREWSSETFGIRKPSSIPVEVLEIAEQAGCV
jgi:hypothetical protein